MCKIYSVETVLVSRQHDSTHGTLWSGSQRRTRMVAAEISVAEAEYISRAAKSRVSHVQNLRKVTHQLYYHESSVPYP